MTYEEARSFIDASNIYGSKLGLTVMTELLRRLENPQDRLKIIHVAGTNGKGSTTAFLSSILAAQGYTVGRYNSPSVFSYREKIQILKRDQESKETKTEIVAEHITKTGVSAAIDTIKPVCEDMVKDGFSHPTSFEIETAMAMLYLSREQVDFAVIEVGLGGRLDATNVIRKPVCSVITTVSMDHMQYLGNTLGQIAAEKAGIIKEGVPAVTNNTNAEVLLVLEQTCQKQGTALITADPFKATKVSYQAENTSFTYEGRNYTIHLLGEYQLANAVLSIETAHLLQRIGYPIKEASIQYGLEQAKWSGRFEVIAREPYFIIDGAHNEDAALKLEKTLNIYFPNRKFLFIMGVFADKDYKRILEITAKYAKVILTVTPHNGRALASSKLAEEAGRYTDGEVIDANSIPSAIKYAYEKADKEDVILAFGSLSFLCEIREYITAHSDLED
jgi:dihydrofolate synthase/folylpolyglutamate synthase